MTPMITRPPLSERLTSSKVIAVLRASHVSALAPVCDVLVEEGILHKLPLRDYVAATSVGVVNGELLLDLNYEEDSQAQVDMNLVETGGGLLVEVQGTAEGNPFSKDDFYQLMSLGSQGTRRLVEVQRRLVHL